MTDLELLGAISGGAVMLGGAARWLVGIWRETSRETTTALVAAQKETRDAMLANTASNVRVSERLETFGDQLSDTKDSVSELRDGLHEVKEFVRRHVTIPVPSKRAATVQGGSRTRTPGLGVRARGGSHGDSED